MNKEKTEEFLEYQEFIVNHPNFEGFPYERKKNGEIKWVETKKTKKGQERMKWWEKRREELNIKKERGWLSTVARKIHPNKIKPCSICGQVLNINYVYLNKYAYKKLNSIEELPEIYDNLSDIRDVVPEILDLMGEKKGFEILSKIFKIPNTIKKNSEDFIEYIIKTSPNTGKCGPGAMSNAPDRLDGFHTYNRCCRSVEDKGRHKENMMKYIDDRRAYEHWSDGNWKAANRLMSEYRKNGVSADHIGPISLGFCHNTKIFQPMTISQQSTKNNKMSYSDVKKLIKIENRGNKIISWHSKYIWNKLKNSVNSNLDAEILSNFMRTNMHFVLSVFAFIYIKGYDDFLKYLLKPNLEYSYYDYEFIGFNPEDGSFQEMIETQLNTQNQENNAKRYIRIAFESLEKYIKKENRNIKNKNILGPKKVKKKINKSIDEIEKNNYDIAKNLLEEAFKLKAEYYKPKYKKKIKNRKY